jgi:hypothetical protein
VRGYKTATDIPNYWAYAKNFVLQDHMFEPSRSASLTAHLFMVSAWSAYCSTEGPSEGWCESALSPLPKPIAAQVPKPKREKRHPRPPGRTTPPATGAAWVETQP